MNEYIAEKIEGFIVGQGDGTSACRWRQSNGAYSAFLYVTLEFVVYHLALEIVKVVSSPLQRSLATTLNSQTLPQRVRPELLQRHFGAA
jgi:hypothetical protein